jgi:hypothetical protein
MSLGVNPHWDRHMDFEAPHNSFRCIMQCLMQQADQLQPVQSRSSLSTTWCGHMGAHGVAYDIRSEGGVRMQLSGPSVPG